MTDTRSIDEVLAAIEARLAEQRYLTEVLALWHHANKAGYTSNCIKSFTFRACLVSHVERVKHRWPMDARDWPCDTHFNCVRLVDGSLVELPLYPRPRKP